MNSAVILNQSDVYYGSVKATDENIFQERSII
jgi:hypothetical protein